MLGGARGDVRKREESNKAQLRTCRLNELRLCAMRRGGGGGREEIAASATHVVVKRGPASRPVNTMLGKREMPPAHNSPSPPEKRREGT